MKGQRDGKKPFKFHERYICPTKEKKRKEKDEENGDELVCWLKPLNRQDVDYYYVHDDRVSKVVQEPRSEILGRTFPSDFRGRFLVCLI